MRLKLLAISVVAMAAVVGCNEGAKKPDTMAKAPAKVASGEMLGNTCSGCHGPKGNSFGPGIPSIAGMSKAYLEQKMTTYKAGDPSATIMTNIAKGYNKAEIAAMSDFYSKQTFMPRAQKHDAKLAATGKKLHDKYCAKCHSNNDPDDDAGFLNGQWMPYLHYTLNDYHSGAAKAPKGMAKKLKALHKDHGDKGIMSLLHYYGSAKF